MSRFRKSGGAQLPETRAHRAALAIFRDFHGREPQQVPVAHSTAPAAPADASAQSGIRPVTQTLTPSPSREQKPGRELTPDDLQRIGAEMLRNIRIFEAPATGPSAPKITRPQPPPQKAAAPAESGEQDEDDIETQKFVRVRLPGPPLLERLRRIFEGLF